MDHLNNLDLTSTTKQAVDNVKETGKGVADKVSDTSAKAAQKVKAEAPSAKPAPPKASTPADAAHHLTNEVKGLSHLGFVADVAAAASSTAGSVYSTVRPYVPSVVDPVVTQVEDTVTAYGAPLVATASDAAGNFLAQADDKVDYAMQVSNKVLVKGKEALDVGTDRLMHKTLDQNLKEAQSIAQQTIMFIQGVSFWFVDKVGITKNVTLAKEKLHEALKTADKVTDPDVAIDIIKEIWDSISSVPAVQAVLSTAEPVTNFGQSSFFKAHDTLVTSSYYKSAVDLSTSTLNWAASTTPYKLSSKYLYPWVRPVAQPAIGKLSGSKQINSAINYWKPSVTV